MKENLMDALIDYGVNYNEVMERFIDDEELYLHCIEMFACDENFRKLKDAMESGDYDKAFVSVHTLKGVVGSLGLKPLYDPVFRLVEALRGKDYSKPEELEALCAEVIKQKMIFDEKIMRTAK